MNNQNKKQVIIAAILGVVLVVVLVWQFLIAGGPAPAPRVSANTSAPAASAAAPAAASAAAAIPAAAPGEEIDLAKLLRNVEMVSFIYENERTSRNPMTPLVGRIIVGGGGTEEAGTVINEFSVRQKNVSGIIYNEFKPIAIVDDEVVTEGHQYADGVTVAQIEPRRVWFKWRDSLIPVELKEL